MSPWYGSIYFFCFSVEINLILFLLSVGGVNAIVSKIIEHYEIYDID